MKQVKITGIHGYLGTLISDELKKEGYAVSGVPRKLLYENEKALANEIRNCELVINLAGVNILRRWTPINKELIYDSRVVTTTTLVNAINFLKENERPRQFISASAIGIYTAGKTHNESSTDFDSGFMGKVVKDWEAPLRNLPQSIQTTIFRIAPVLGKDSMTISKLMLPFKLGLGGKVASGKQPFPFVHEQDLINAFVWAIRNKDKSGLFNLAAPENINNSEFTNQFAKILHRPAFFTVPAFALKLFFGQASDMLIQSPQAEPEALEQAGFSFTYPDIHSTLSDILA